MDSALQTIIARYRICRLGDWATQGHNKWPSAEPNEKDKEKGKSQEANDESDDGEDIVVEADVDLVDEQERWPRTGVETVRRRTYQAYCTDLDVRRNYLHQMRHETYSWFDWGDKEKRSIQTKCPEIAPLIYPINQQLKSCTYQRVKRRRIGGTLTGQMG